MLILCRTQKCDFRLQILQGREREAGCTIRKIPVKIPDVNTREIILQRIVRVNPISQIEKKKNIKSMHQKHKTLTLTITNCIPRRYSESQPEGRIRPCVSPCRYILLFCASIKRNSKASLVSENWSRFCARDLQCHSCTSIPPIITTILLIVPRKLPVWFKN